MTEQAERGLDWGATFSGLVTALMTLMVGGLLVGFGLYTGTLPFAWSARLVMAVQIAAGLLAGVRVGRRVSGSGLVHGLLVGALVVAVMGGLDAVRSSAPGLPDLMRSGSLLLVASAAGGIVGINFLRQGS